jgi:VWFA-related protein
MLLRLTMGFVLGWAILAQGPPAAELPVIRSTSRLVNVNVLAVDKKGNPVRDLTRDDFVLMDSGALRPISLFALETADGAGHSTAAPLPAGTFTNRVDEKASSVTIFLFDGLNTKFEDQASARTDLLKYLKSVEPGDRVALFSLGQNLLLVHDFTSDAKVLADAITRQGTRGNREVADGDPMASNTGDAVLDRMLNASNQGIADYTNELRASKTSAALEAIAAHAARVPGRKNLVWVSGGFPMAIGYGRRNATNPQIFTTEVDRAVRALNDADIAVYPVDARRLEARSATDASGAIARPLSARGQTQAIGMASKDDPNFQPMEELADGTGGRAFHNINDLAAAIHAATNDARVSYALAFSPADSALDGKYHAIKVEVKRPGVQLRYRAGYVAFADAPKVTLGQAIMSPADFTAVGITVNLKPAPGGISATFTIDPKNLTIEKMGDDYQVTIEMIMVTGKMTHAPKYSPVKLKIGADAKDRVMTEGLLVGMNLKGSTGPMAYHIGVRDTTSGAIGTLHLVKN